MLYAVLQGAFRVAGYALGFALVAALFRRKIIRTFPFCAAYLMWRLVRTPVVTVVRAHYGYWSDAYASAYWVTSLVSWALFFLVILELYENIFRAFPGLRRFFRMAILFGTTGTILLIAAAQPMASSGPHQWINTWMYSLQRSVRFAHAGLLLTLVVFIRWLRLPISNLLRSLTLAWLIVSSFGFAYGAVRSQLGPNVDQVLYTTWQAIETGVDCFLLWAVLKWGSEAEPQPAFEVIDEDSRHAVLAKLENIMSAIARR